MNTIYIRYEGLSPSWSGDAVTGQIGTLRCSFEFDESWDGYETKYMVVARENTIFDPVELDATNSAYVPEIALRERCYLKIGAVGLCKGETTKRYNGRPCRVAVDQGNLIPDPKKEPDENGSETAYEQIILQLLEKLDKNQGTENAGKALVIGEDGNVTPGEVQSNVQADWEQNDSTAPDYVKNRPIWRERRVVCDILAEAPSVGEIVQIYSGKVSDVTKVLIDPNSSNPPDCFKMIFEVDLDVNGTISHGSYPLTVYTQMGGNNCILRQAQFNVYVIDDISTLAEEYVSKFTATGIYLEYWKASPVIKFTNIEIYWALHNQLVEQYIPTTIARKTDIPYAVETALTEAKKSGDFKGDPGDDYVLTDADKTEIAELAADMVDIPDGGGGSSSSEWTKLGDITVSGTYEFNILSIDGGVVTLDTNAEGYSFMNEKRNIIVHPIDISANYNVSRYLLQLMPKDYSAGTFDVYNMDGVKQSSVAFNTTQYKLSVQNIWSVVMTGIPQYDRYKMRAFFPVMHSHGLRAIFSCNVSSLGFGASTIAGFGPSIFEKELFTFPYDPNYMVEKATITYGNLCPTRTDTRYNAVSIIKAGENQTRPKNDTIEFMSYHCPFVNGTRFEVWGG